jgi:NRAMP (natural resistance-associated macrophage protein)-like metal ion transporter
MAKDKKPFFKKIVHGLISGAADNDPSGISTYSIVGALTGFAQLWLVVISTPLLINIQSICARLGDVTKKGLAQVMKETYGKKVAVFTLLLLIIGNITTLGANFAAVEASIELLFPSTNAYFLLPLIALFVWWVVVFKSYKTISKFLTVISMVFVGYVVTGFLVSPNWIEVLKATFVPQIEISKDYLLPAVAFLGTTITPFLFYWQTTQEVEDHPTVKDVPFEFSQNSFGFIFSNTITFFIIVTTGTLFFKQGLEINTAADAANALVPLAGEHAKLLFAIGIIGSGMLAIPVLSAVTAYAVAETFGWKKGLNHSPKKAKAFYTTLSASFLVGLSIALSNFPTIKALFYSQVINGILAPFLIIFILSLASNPNVVGKYKSPFWQNVLGWATVAIMMVAIVGMFF